VSYFEFDNNVFPQIPLPDSYRDCVYLISVIPAYRQAGAGNKL
jgi:hypothetical protein